MPEPALRTPAAALLLGLALLPGAAAAQEPAAGARAGGIESLLERLEAATRARREAARTAWREFGPAFRAAPEDEEPRRTLLALAPEIQEPVLEELARAAEDPDSGGRLLPLLELAAEVCNAAGADRLAALAPRLPLALRPPALEAAAARGGPRTRARLEELLTAPDPLERLAAVRALLAHGPPERAAFWLARLDPAGLDAGELSAGLATLAARGLPEDFRLPPAWLETPPAALLPGILALLEVRPEEAALPLLTDLALDREAELEARGRTLAILEEHARRFRARESLRRLAEHLEEHPTDRLNPSIAWTLHDLGDKKGARWLLAGPKAEVEASPRDWRAWRRLARVQLGLGDYNDSWRSWKTVEGLVRASSSRFGGLDLEDWVDAARAACGARKTRDAATWLEQAARLAPRGLAEYRDAPEFEPYLKKQPFKSLLRVED